MTTSGRIMTTSSHMMFQKYANIYIIMAYISEHATTDKSLRW